MTYSYCEIHLFYVRFMEETYELRASLGKFCDRKNDISTIRRILAGIDFWQKINKVKHLCS